MGKQRDFIVSPPGLVKALMDSKLSEQMLQNKLKQAVKKEAESRPRIQDLQRQMRELQSQLNFYQGSAQSVTDSFELSQESKRLIELEAENEGLKARILDSNFLTESSRPPSLPPTSTTNIPNGTSLQDYNMMMESILVLSHQLSQYESSQAPSPDL